VRSPYRDDGSPLPWLLQALVASFRLGRLFGVEVQVYWIAVVLMPLLFLQWFAPITSGTFECLLLTAFAFASLYLVVWTHEMGHIMAGWRYRIHTPRITLSPLGGVAHMGASAPGPRAEVWISLAGPATHLAWLAVCWPLSLLCPWGTLRIEGFATDPLALALHLLVRTNQSLLLFNLLPLFPMDGGRVLRALLSMRLHPNRATLIATAIGIAGAIGFIVYGLATHGAYGTILVFIGIANLQSALAERTAARHTLVYESPPAEPWRMDPDAWRHGAGGASERRGWLARLGARRAQAKADRQNKASLAEEAELDQVLKRVHEVGITQLSPKERKVLQRAAERRRGTG
jgi:Zn-dependent protease